MQHIVHSGALFSASLSDLIDRFWRSYALLIDNSIQFYSEAATQWQFYTTFSTQHCCMVYTMPIQYNIQHYRSKSTQCKSSPLTGAHILLLRCIVTNNKVLSAQVWSWWGETQEERESLPSSMSRRWAGQTKQQWAASQIAGVWGHSIYCHPLPSYRQNSP